MPPGLRKIFKFLLIFVSIFLFIRYLLPLLLPFLLGGLLALAAEPLVRFLHKNIHLPRTAAAGIGITMSFSFLALTLMLLCAAALRQLSQMSSALPQLEEAARSGLHELSAWLMALAQAAPGELQTVLSQQVSDFFSSGSALVGRVTAYLLSLASGLLGRIPDSFLSIGTGIISSFMISAKLPALTQALTARIPRKTLDAGKSLLTQLKSTVGRWIKAQAKLSGINFLLISCGFLILRIPHPLLWGFLTALVDAFPVLGTGTVLIPWSLVSFLQGYRLRAFGLLGVYAAATLNRSILEPRLVGHQLGLDPLATLMALYAGYQLWGLPGMLLAPMLAAAAIQLAADSPPIP